MSEMPYTPLAGKISKYLEKIQEASVPPKATNTWLKSLGFTTGNDYHLLKILESIGFVDNSRVPTDLWKRYKDPTKSRAVMAQGIRIGYGDLFSTYTDAHRKDREALYAYFSSKSGKAKTTVDLMVSTFTNLCALADFEAEAPVLPQTSIGQTSPQTQAAVNVVTQKGFAPELHINIQLHLPPTTDPAVYDNLFKSMKKHLLSAGD